MIVYADILIAVNIIVDYFLLSAAGKLLGKRSSALRLLAGALIGGISSLMLFLPATGLPVELLLKTAVCALMVLCSFGFGNTRLYIKSCGVLFLITCAFGGMLYAAYSLFRPNGMLMHNGVVYFNLSPLVLIACSTAVYFLFLIGSYLFSKTAKTAETCNISVFADGSSIRLTGILDTGNSMSDALGGSEIIIVDRACVTALFGSTELSKNPSLQVRYRALPCSTVSGGGILDGYRCDSAVLNDGERTVRLKKPVLAVSKAALNDRYNAIVNPQIFH